MGVSRSSAEPFRRLLERFGVADSSQETEIVSVSLSTALGSTVDPSGILGYVAGLGIIVRTPDDLMRVNEVADEEELSAHLVAEGVAVTIASQGEWILFRP